MATPAPELPNGSAVIVITPDEGSPEAFRAFVDELLATAEPDLETIEAADALRELRADAPE